MFAQAYTRDWQFGFAADLEDADVQAAMKDAGLGLITLGGDYYGNYVFVYGFKDLKVPILAATGNHDKCSKVAAADNIKDGKCAYGFRWNNVGFIVVNTQKKLADQDGMIEGLMKKYQADDKLDHIVTVQHKPAVTGPNEHHLEKEANGFKAFYIEMGQKYPKFTLALAGHNHNYLECKPSGQDVTFITDGTGGRDPYPLGKKMDDNCGNGLSGSKYNGFSIVNVGPDSISSRHVNVG
jgi:hypothetical protein